MHEEGLSDDGLRSVESYFLSRVESIAAANNKTLVIWDDPVGEGVNVSTKIKLQVWNQGMNLVNKLSQQGYQTVFSQPFYLDNLDNDWGTIYEVQDLDDKLPGLLGAEAWSEFSLSTTYITRYLSLLLRLRLLLLPHRCLRLRPV